MSNQSFQHFLTDGKQNKTKKRQIFVCVKRKEKNIPSSGSFLNGSACLKRLNFDDDTLLSSLLLSISFLFFFNPLVTVDGISSDGDAAAVVETEDNAEQEYG